MFIGRKKELNWLEKKYDSNRAEFLVIYGRRRIGKTALLNEFSQKHTSIFYTAKEITNNKQLELFSQKVVERYSDKDFISSFDSWEKAFKYLIKKDNDKKLVVILDEFPYIVQNNKALPSILQNLWDEFLNDKNIMLILCGSSMSFVEDKILSEKNPLYGRTTGIYKVLELDFFTSCAFLKTKNKINYMYFYAITGGVPYYLLELMECENFQDAARDKALNSGEVLYNEAEYLLRQELREPAVYYSIIEAVALGNTRLNDIYNKTQIEKNKISVYLKNLMDLRIVEREFPVLEKVKKRANAHNGLYRLSSNYFRFYFSFIYPYYSELEHGNVVNIYKQVVEPNIDKLVSYIFENVCLQYLRKENENGLLPFDFLKAGRWWDKQKEIDILAYDVFGNYLFGECKWRNEKVDVKTYEKLIKKSKYINVKAKNNYYYLFSKTGFTKKLIDIEKTDDKLFLISYKSIIDSVKKQNS